MSDEETEGWERMMTHHEVYDDDSGFSSLFKGFTIVSSEMNDKSHRPNFFQDSKIYYRVDMSGDEETEG